MNPISNPSSSRATNIVVQQPSNDGSQEASGSFVRHQVSISELSKTDASNSVFLKGRKKFYQDENVKFFKKGEVYKDPTVANCCVVVLTSDNNYFTHTHLDISSSIDNFIQDLRKGWKKVKSMATSENSELKAIVIGGNSPSGRGIASPEARSEVLMENIPKKLIEHGFIVAGRDLGGNNVSRRATVTVESVTVEKKIAGIKKEPVKIMFTA